ncbi:hypothetical protein HETIRDRAFT_430202 [Heterobasidion irregulare TC 32-1]|uniref:Uncharacterized protein n=1 Tax=Heterobasidion irregulare (strain TC 32-1) TaxID=747525 RepID=W4JTR5_HETIT|nr:uncharacterized protein HETIRDRAFT_430202 [Heterobasidion irregulare TC 32-1]ETW76952.1 hypothetical protein HETIRDRAFT_430202 [Heterobasidion irregulare TC 32-1]
MEVEPKTPERLRTHARQRDRERRVEEMGSPEHSQIPTVRETGPSLDLDRGRLRLTEAFANLGTASQEDNGSTNQAGKGKIDTRLLFADHAAIKIKPATNERAREKEEDWTRRIKASQIGEWQQKNGVPWRSSRAPAASESSQSNSVNTTLTASNTQQYHLVREYGWCFYEFEIGMHEDSAFIDSSFFAIVDNAQSILELADTETLLIPEEWPTSLLKIQTQLQELWRNDYKELIKYENRAMRTKKSSSSYAAPDCAVRMKTESSQKYDMLQPVVFLGEAKMKFRMPQAKPAGEKGVCASMHRISAQLAWSLQPTLKVFIGHLIGSAPLKPDGEIDWKAIKIPKWLFVYGIGYDTEGFLVFAFFPVLKIQGSDPDPHGKVSATPSWGFHCVQLGREFEDLFTRYNVEHRIRAFKGLLAMRQHASNLTSRLRKGNDKLHFPKEFKAIALEAREGHRS